MAIANIITFILVLLGAINWGLVGIFDWNFVTAIFGSGRTVGSIIVYVLILLSALWLLFSSIYSRGKIDFKDM